MGRGYGITPPAYWLLAAWHWSETGKPAYRGRYEYAKAWLLFMIKAYLIWKWEQARWLKEHWVVGQKEKKRWGEKQREGKRGERRETPSNPHRRWGVETGMSQLFSDSSSKCRTLQTSLGTKVIVAFCTFCMLHQKVFIQKLQLVILVHFFLQILLSNWLMIKNWSYHVKKLLRTLTHFHTHKNAVHVGVTVLK